MSDAIAQRAAQDLNDIEAVTAVLLPEPSTDLVPVDLDAAEADTAIQARVAELDMADANSIIEFGSSAQTELQSISQAMLTDVRNKDVGPAGDSLGQIVTTIRGFSSSELDLRRKRSFWEKLTFQAAPFARFMSKYEGVQGQIDKITDNLLNHEHKLLKDIKSLDKLYEKTLDFYNELGLYIAAGDAKLNELDTSTIPALEAEANAAEGDEGVLKAQALRDMRAARDDLERRVHDLRLTRQVTMQSLPSIRLVQENDKSLISKIKSTLVNTVPLWETQLAQAVTIERSAQAAAAVKDATDLTNELLTKNAENLREANRAVRTEMERGVFDIESVKAANANLIATIEESLAIADEGKRKRAEAENELVKMEAELRKTLSSARARNDKTGVTLGGAEPEADA